MLQCPRPFVEVLAALSHAPRAALEANAYMDSLPAAAQSYVRTDARLEGVQEASSSSSGPVKVTAGTDVSLLGVEHAIRKVCCCMCAAPSCSLEFCYISHATGIP